MTNLIFYINTINCNLDLRRMIINAIVKEPVITCEVINNLTVIYYLETKVIKLSKKS